MLPENKTFIIALIEESQEALDDLKDAIREDDGTLLSQSIMRLSALKLAAKKWMKE